MKAINRRPVAERRSCLGPMRGVPYGVVMTTISSIRRAGIEKIGMVTETNRQQPLKDS